MSDLTDAYKRHVERIKQKVSCHDIAEFLKLERQGEVRGGNATYFAPWGSKKNTTVSIFNDGAAWYDHSEGSGGSVIDLWMRAEQVQFKDAVRAISEHIGLPLPKSEAEPNAGSAPRREEPLHEMIARQCLKEPRGCIEYLTGRGIDAAVVERAIAKKTLGFNDYRSPKIPANEPNHGGPAVGFIMVTPNPGHVVAVEMRYIEPATNGGIKNKCLGDKSGNVWCSNWGWLQRDECHTVYIVEGPINALSIESAGLPGTAVVATMGTENIEKVDWRFLRGKRVLICLDHNDPINTKENSKLFGHRAGLYFAWRLHEILTGCDISAMLVDQDGWPEGKDVNDLLKEEGKKVAERLINVEEWLIPGMKPEPKLDGKRRVWLRPHHFHKYSRFRVTEDTCRWITGYETKKNEDGSETQSPKFEDVASFRVAAISRVSIQSATATMTGDSDSSPKTLFAVSCQAPRHKNRLMRAVFDDAHLHKMDRWERFGSVLSQAGFRRMVQVLETTTDIGARDAVNLVGLCWRGGRLSVNEGHECYFSNPDLQCPYVNLIFPRGTKADGREVLRAYQAMFTHNAASIVLTWALGGHLKTILGFWPHLTLQGRKGSGKSTLMDALQRGIAMTMFSGKSLDSSYRISKSVCHTLHPVGWEEISARGQVIIDKAVSLLQEAYNFRSYPYGAENHEMLSCAPVLMAGEDVPVKSLIGKLVNVNLNGKKGTRLPLELPKFPVRQWLEWLTDLDKREVLETFERLKAHCVKSSRANNEDDGASRMAENYAALLLAWSLLAEFLDIDPTTGDLGTDVLASMNSHIKESAGDREPWVWIVEKILSEIASREFRYPNFWDRVRHEDGERPCLLIRTSHMMDHIARTPALKAMWDGLPIKSDRVLKEQLIDAKALLLDSQGDPRTFERIHGADTFNNIPGRRVAHLVALDLKVLETFGVYAVGDASVLDAAAPEVSS